MSDGHHLLVPFAACEGEPCRAALRELQLPHLERLLPRLALAGTDTGDARTLSMPHERAFARAVGLDAPDGLLPLAAWAAREAGHDPGGRGWAWITPCHWRVATDHIRMHQPQELQLAADESQALLAAMRPYFEQDGLTLAYHAPDRWLAAGPLFADLPLASLDRVAGRVIDPWIPRSEAARPLRRLQQEMQMLLYTAPANDARAARGLLPVNSFWASGTGVLPAGAAGAQPAGLEVDATLHGPALRLDGAAWAEGWRRLDAGPVAALLRRLDAGTPVALTLCGENSARTWQSAGTGWRQRVAGLLPRKRAADLLQSL